MTCTFGKARTHANPSPHYPQVRAHKEVSENTFARVRDGLVIAGPRSLSFAMTTIREDPPRDLAPMVCDLAVTSPHSIPGQTARSVILNHALIGAR